MKETLRIAAIADLHIKRPDKSKYSDDFLRNIIREASLQSDCILLCGDTAVTFSDGNQVPVGGTEYAADILSEATKQVLFIPGNHDRSDRSLNIFNRVRAVRILDGESYGLSTTDGFLYIIGITGGYDGSFSDRIFPQRQRVIQRGKALFEKNLARLATMLDRTPREDPVIIAMHYAPVYDTSHKFIDGSVRFGQLIDEKRGAENTLVLHGHAHKGQEVTYTEKGIPVYNVAFPVVSATQAFRKGHTSLQPTDCFQLFEYKQGRFYQPLGVV